MICDNAEYGQPEKLTPAQSPEFLLCKYGGLATWLTSVHTPPKAPTTNYIIGLSGMAPLGKKMTLKRQDISRTLRLLPRRLFGQKLDLFLSNVKLFITPFACPLF